MVGSTTNNRREEAVNPARSGTYDGLSKKHSNDMAEDVMGVPIP
jgi:hypothetical protein